MKPKKCSNPDCKNMVTAHPMSKAAVTFWYDRKMRGMYCSKTCLDTDQPRQMKLINMHLEYLKQEAKHSPFKGNNS